MAGTKEAPSWLALVKKWIPWTEKQPAEEDQLKTDVSRLMKKLNSCPPTSTSETDDQKAKKNIYGPSVARALSKASPTLFRLGAFPPHQLADISATVTVEGHWCATVGVIMKNGDGSQTGINMVWDNECNKIIDSAGIGKLNGAGRLMVLKELTQTLLSQAKK